MKKTLTIVLFVCLALVVAYGAAGYWVGGQARNQHDLLIAQINRSNYMEASIKSYERGLFSSRAVTTFTLILPESGNPIKFSIINYIYHGPFVFLENQHLKKRLRPVLAVIRTRLAPGDSGEALEKLLEKIPELESSEILTVLSTDGGGESYFDVPAFQKKFPDEKGGHVEVEWRGFTAQCKFDLASWGSRRLLQLSIPAGDGTEPTAEGERYSGRFQFAYRHKGDIGWIDCPYDRQYRGYGEGECLLQSDLLGT